jgi:hypothetical protein
MVSTVGSASLEREYAPDGVTYVLLESFVKASPVFMNGGGAGSMYLCLTVVGIIWRTWKMLGRSTAFFSSRRKTVLLNRPL